MTRHENKRHKSWCYRSLLKNSPSQRMVAALQCPECQSVNTRKERDGTTTSCLTVTKVEGRSDLTIGTKRWEQSQLTDGHKTELMDGDTIWNNSWERNWYNNWKISGVGPSRRIVNLEKKSDAIGRSMESVVQSVGSDQTREACRQIGFELDTAACRRVAPARRPARRGSKVHRDAEAGGMYLTAGKSVEG